MLIVTIPEQEGFNEKTQKFVKVDSHKLKLEHSLLSLQKWESKHKKYFIDNKDLTSDEILDYIKFMTLNQVDDYVYNFLTKENMDQIMDYIKNPMTATFFYEDPTKPVQIKKKEIITSELIYAQMIMLGIPVELFEKRHLNHVLTLIRVCAEKQNPDSGNKVSQNQLARHYSELNKARKAKLGTRG